MTYLHICAPRGYSWRAIEDCRCGPRRRFVVTDVPWYERTWTCCRCGRSVDSEGTQRGRAKPREWPRLDALWRNAATKAEAWAELEAELALYVEKAS